MNDSVATNTELVYGQQNIWTDSFTEMFQCQNVKSIGMKSGVDGWMKPRSRKLGLEGCRGSALLCRVLFCCVSTLTVTLLLPGMTLPRRVVFESMARGLLLCTRATGSARRARLSLCSQLPQPTQEVGWGFNALKSGKFFFSSFQTDNWQCTGLGGSSLSSSTSLVRVPNLYFGSRLGAQYPKNSKNFL